MGSLLQEMRELENPIGPQHRLAIQPGPNVADFAFDSKNWAEDFLRSETHVIPGDVPSASAWGQEFLDQPRFMGAGPGYASPATDWDTQWDNLTSHIEKPSMTVAAALPGDALARTATEIVDSMSDPKFAQSEVNNLYNRVFCLRPLSV
jgi:hypothetical protein